jgi:S1-C subfamily serine protease
MKKMTVIKLGLALALLAVGQPLFAAEQPSVIAARKIYSEQQDSVLWVSGVARINLSAEGGEGGSIPEQERKFEALATVIGANGLLVASLDTIDPSHQISGKEVKMGNSKVRLDASVTIKELNIVMPDGTEVPAEVVMKDVDLNLAFIRAKADSKEMKGQTFKAVDLKDSAKAVIGEEVVSLGRMDEVLNRQPSVANGQVTVLVKKPREFVKVTSAMPGSPTFNLDGKLIGIAATRFAKQGGAIVLIPAADVVEIAEQAKTAKPAKEEPKTESKSESK